MKFLKKFINSFINKTFSSLRLKKNQSLLFKNYFIRGAENKKIIDMVNKFKKFSMTGESRMFSLCQAVRHVNSLKLKGDFVECGVWKGGNLLLLNRLKNYYNLNKSIYGYDTFEGMTPPSNNDYDYNNISAKQLLENKNLHQKKNIWCYASLEEVKNYIKKYAKSNSIKLIKGPVEKTLLKKKICLNRYRY